MAAEQQGRPAALRGQPLRHQLEHQASRSLEGFGRPPGMHLQHAAPEQRSWPSRLTSPFARLRAEEFDGAPRCLSAPRLRAALRARSPLQLTGHDQLLCARRNTPFCTWVGPSESQCVEGLPSRTGDVERPARRCPNNRRIQFGIADELKLAGVVGKVATFPRPDGRRRAARRNHRRGRSILAAPRTSKRVASPPQRS